MGSALDLTTVAEGIETTDQAQRMAALGCVYGQGYYFARPVGVESIEAELVRLRKRSAGSVDRPRRATKATAGNLRLLPTPRLGRVTA
jgi:predicted signal transduction protein with EAL and GGDEF domain